MELKCFRLPHGSERVFCSNRTFMELKLSFCRILDTSITGSNRTFMELKFERNESQ